MKHGHNKVNTQGEGKGLDAARIEPLTATYLAPGARQQFEYHDEEAKFVVSIAKTQRVLVPSFFIPFSSKKKGAGSSPVKELLHKFMNLERLLTKGAATPAPAPADPTIKGALTEAHATQMGHKKPMYAKITGSLAEIEAGSQSEFLSEVGVPGSHISSLEVTREEVEEEEKEMSKLEDTSLSFSAEEPKAEKTEGAQPGERTSRFHHFHPHL